MKTTTTLLLCCAMLASSCKYNRVGSLTMVSTRNVDPAKPGVVLMRSVEAKAKTKHDDAMQEAIDQAVRQHPGGEYLMNCAVYVKSNGNWVKVQGDVWGTPTADGVATGVQTGGITLQVGDRVAWKQGSSMLTGTIVGMRPGAAVVEYVKPTMLGNSTDKAMKEVQLTSLTKVE